MASASCLRAERFLRTASPRYSSSPSFVGRVYEADRGRRCFSVGKGPTDGKTKQNRNKSKGSKKDGNDSNASSSSSSYKKLNEVPLRFPPPPVWGNQIHHLRSQRRPRFGPKSHKHLQAATSPQRKYGIAAVRNLNLKLLKDSSNVPILIPGRILKENEKSGGACGGGGGETMTKTIRIMNKNVGSGSSSIDPQNDRNDGKPPPPPPRRRRRKLPMVDASALLDKHAYCKRSAFPGGTATKSGHEAAKRLLRGKKDLVDMIRGTIVYQQSQRPFCLTGHGIPPQLLQDHINMADSILKNFNEPAECQLISNLDDSSSNTDPSCPDSMTIRRQDGQTRIWPWPPQKLLQRSDSFRKDRRHYDGDDDDDDALKDISQSWENSLVLYLAVMDRLSKELGPSAVGSYLNKESKKNWNVKMYRGMAYPIELISRPDDEEDGRPVPILEWSPVNSSSNNSSSNNNSRKHPHVSIRLQGTPDSNQGSESDGKELIRNPVTLVYDAIFQEDPRLEPVRAAPS